MFTSPERRIIYWVFIERKENCFFFFNFIHTYRMFEKLGVNSSPALLTCPRVPGHCCLSWSRSKSPFCRLGLYGNCRFFRVPTSIKHLQQIQTSILVCLSLHFPKDLSDSSALLIFMDALSCLSGVFRKNTKSPRSLQITLLFTDLLSRGHT